MSVITPGLRFLSGERARTAVAVGVLLPVSLLFYRHLWLPDLVLIKRDAFWFHLPIKRYLMERLTAGELPQWIPYEGLGRPFIGAMASGVFHPFTLLYGLLSVSDAYRLSTLCACLSAAGGAFVLARLLRISLAGSVLSGVAFALSGYVVSLTDNIVYLYSLCILPLFCWGLEQARLKSRVWTVVPAVIWSTVFFNGDAQTGYYYGFLALVWMGLRASGSYREAGVRLALTGVLTAFLAGIQLGPAAAVFMESNRSQAALFHEQTVRWSTHPLRLLTLMASPIGSPADPEAAGRYFFGSPHYGLWAESLYLGIPILSLALLGVWHRRDLLVFAILAIFALWLALGRYGGLYEWFDRAVPLWSAFRYPEKFMGVFSFAAAMLAGAGLDALCEGKGPPSLWFVLAILAAGCGLTLLPESAASAAASFFEAPPAVSRAITASAGQAFLYSSATAAGLWVLAVGFKKKAGRSELLVACALVLVAADLARANGGAYHTGPAKTAIFTPALVRTLTAQEGPLEPGRFRLVSTPSETAWPDYLQHRLGYYGAVSVARRQALDLGHNVDFHLETIQPYLPGYHAELAIMLKDRPGMEAEARLNVRYYIDRRARLKDPMIARALLSELPDYDLALFRNPFPVKPRAYLSPHPETAVSPVDPRSLFIRPEFLSGSVDVVETSGAALPSSAPHGSVTIERYAPEDVLVRVEAAEPAVLVLLDSFDAGWRATFESGETLPIRRANALVRAVTVPAGSHRIRFAFETPWLRAGAAASLIGACFGLILIIRSRHTLFSA